METIIINADQLTTGSIIMNDSSALYYITDDSYSWKVDGTAYGYQEPHYKLRKCECCGGPIRGLTCSYCGAEYERY